MSHNPEKAGNIRARISEEEIAEEDRKNGFGNVTEKGEKSARLSEGAEHICHSRISASAGTFL